MTLMGVVRSTGAVIPPLLILIVALWVVRIPFATLLVDGWPDALWWSYPLRSAIAALLAIAYYRWGVTQGKDDCACICGGDVRNADRARSRRQGTTRDRNLISACVR